MGKHRNEAEVEHGDLAPTVSSLNILVVLASAIASIVFGYALSAIAGTLAQPSFIRDYLSGPDASSVIGGALGGFYAGSFLGAVGQSPISSRYGRRMCAIIAAVLVVLGSALTAGSVHVAMFIVGRIVTGAGAGVLHANTPVYMSEISPAHARGSMVGAHGMTITFAYTVSGITALGFTYVQHDYAWRLQFVLVGALGLIFGVVVCFLPESPRWLIDHDRAEEGWKVVRSLHKTKSDPQAHLARAEFAQITAQLQAEKQLPTSYAHIFTQPSTRKRAICGLLVWTMGQSTGVLVIANFAPIMFRGLGFGTLRQFGLNIAWLGTILVFNGFSLALVDRIGRVRLLAMGGYTTALCMLIEAVLQKYYLGTTNQPGLAACVFMYMLFAACFGIFIEVPSYCYLVEIWPTHLRTQGATIGIGAYFLTTIAYNSPASLAFNTIGYKYYFVFVAMTLLVTPIFQFYAPETAGLTLEEIAGKFGDRVVVEFAHAETNSILEKKGDSAVYHVDNHDDDEARENA